MTNEMAPKEKLNKKTPANDKLYMYRYVEKKTLVSQQNGWR